MSDNLIIYLDESGDSGFDFDNTRPSRFFVIMVLLCMDTQTNRATMQAVSRTLRVASGTPKYLLT